MGEPALVWAEEHGLGKDLQGLCQDEFFKRAVLDELQQHAVKARLPSFEAVRAVHLDPTPWEPGGELLTPSLQLRRKKAQDKYQEAIEDMYNRLEADAGETLASSK